MNNYDSLIGKMLDGRYRLTGIRGIGGMGVVYEADDLAMKRKVAVKMLKDEVKEDAQEVKRFINESRAVAMLSHPNIVHIYDVSVKNSENQYIVMELIDGITLKDYMVKRDRLQWREAASYAEQILNALNHAHGRGIIHRDIKPQNVMLLRNGNLKITDFGIAKMRDSEPLTMTDKAIGTVHYISPEQANGIGVTNVSDIYSTGVLLYEMATGKLPFEGDTAINVAMKQISEIPKNPRELNPEIPKGLAQIILKAMNKAPADRYQSAGEMIKQLSILSANAAVVFNHNHNPNNQNNQAAASQGNGSNLPVAIQGTDSQKAVRAVNKTVEGRERKEITLHSGGKKNISDVDKVRINEDEMRRRGRTAKKGGRRKNSRSMLPIISGVTLAFLIVLLLSGTVILWRLMNGSDVTEMVAIPNYVGRLFDEELKSEMEKERLYVRHEAYVTNDDFEEGAVISHLPEYGDIKKIKSGEKVPVDVVISKGRETYIVEDLRVMRYTDIKVMLNGKGIKVEQIVEDHDTIPSGYIIYSNPGPGTELNPGDTITLYVSKVQSPKVINMPYVVGMSETDAIKRLTNDEIGIKRIEWEYSDTVPKGYVMRQDISGRQVTVKSTRVVLTISKGREFPEPTEPTTNTPPPVSTTAADNTGG